MFISNSRYYQATVQSKIPNGKTVYLGQDLFLGVALDYGTTLPIDKVHAYGLYTYDCVASNNADFLSTGTNRVIRLTDATTGCIAGTLQSGKAFYLSEGFKVASKDGADALGIISDTTTGTYNFVQLSGKFDAAKWLVGGNDHVYFRCKVKFCRNQDFKTSSKCWDVCANHPNVDYTARRRRDVNKTTDPYPPITVTANVKLARPPQAKEEVKVECVSNVVAYSTMLALSMLLLVAMGVTLMLFVKLSSRQKKKA
ncbi:uncharacterized protein LOC132714031 [Ruditapes philippinarum]|uniref:uncharacterized protein LOC132714031 n=1 Tax=Ruditapes philippinarum TaxID=129788 RepID=UPI00295BCFDE|nr:uncharacterized protein LOC132714031 [Ruditapes philippinarum]